MENGFSQVNTVNTSTTETKSNNSTMGGSLSSAALALFNISLNGNINKTTGATGTTQNSKQKIHTPSSMFSILRLKLHEEGLVHHIKDIDDISDLKCGDIIEFRSNLTNERLLSDH